MPELLSTLKAIYEKEHRNNKFMAALQGIDIDSESTSTEPIQPVEKNNAPTTLEDVYARAIKRLGGSENESEAIRHGFTPEMGLEYEVIHD